MTRKEIYTEMEGAFGFVPGFFKVLPDSTLELEWKLFVRSQVEEGPIPNKMRELIGLGIAANSKCRYCTFFHTEMAKLNGATAAEIEDAIHVAKSSAGWSAHLNGHQIDYNEFKDEILRACEHIRRNR